MKKNSVQGSPLGKESEYPSAYAPDILFAIPRSQGRDSLKIAQPLPFYGVDIWTAYELSWLNAKGKPQVAWAEFAVPCESLNIIESKSLKLYLNSFNQDKFDSKQKVIDVIESDLSRCAEAAVTVEMANIDTRIDSVSKTDDYLCIDHLDVQIDHYHPDASLLKADKQTAANERLVSHLLKSNCPVTGQPDWASLFIDYAGAQIEHAGLLRYLVSYREHMGFHEQCVEQIFMDIMRECQPTRLTINARYLRRGGLDINPVRSTGKEFPIVSRQVRQ